MSERHYVLYDARACGSQGTENATVLVSSGSEKEARKDAKIFKSGPIMNTGACYSYAVKGNELTDEKWEWDF